MDAGDIVAAAVNMAFQRDIEVVYCCIRRYESWLPSALEKNGFQLWASQAVMVKHTVQHIAKGAPESSAVMDPNRIPVSSPFVRHYKHQKHGNGKQSKERREKVLY
ncbi:MAG: hypothetical protein R3C44_08830 [Chloroflexota bacterium]